MKQTKYTLPNGVESYIIESEEGSVLVRNDGLRFGIKQYLGLKYRDKDGVLLTTPVYEQPDDYSEDTMTEEEVEWYNNYTEAQQ